MDAGNHGGDADTPRADGVETASAWVRDAAPTPFPTLEDCEVSRARTSLVDGAEQAVRKWLLPGRFREGDRLPTEARLAEMLGISRGTLRVALRRLEDSGEIIRRQGSGTFVGRLRSLSGSVSVPWLRADRYSLRASAGAVSVAALSVEIGPVGEPAATAFGVDREQRSVRIRRVMLVAGVPAAVCEDVLHPDLRLPDAAVLRAEMCGANTVHEMLIATTGIAFSYKRTRIGSRLVEPDDAVGRLLALTVPAACVTLEEVSTAAGRSIHYARDVVVPGQVEIEVVESMGDAQPDPIVDREP